MYEQKSQNTENSKCKLPKYTVILVICVLLLMLASFMGGIFTVNSEWYKNKFSTESHQIDTSEINLEIASLKPYNTALFKKAKTQADMNIASAERYEHYHKYYEKVVERIINHDFNNDIVKTAIISYLNGYEKRKAEIDYVMFPCKDKPVEDCGYGTMLGSVYSTAMLEFDRQELLTYRMILTYMYASISTQDINAFFAE